ncbi:MAG: CocE/NonD family hydrolase [Thiohalorhabdus sp.]|uniref:CocE/NonD family hydrolase n=1 Tax=Thiohalorhabdus sp. TaxID=3094134 RepID=UPI00397F96CE
MKTVHEFPRPVRELENVWVPLPDGTRLAARVWLPEDAEEHPVPAILEYIPYRKRDMTRDRDDQNHPYFAGHGYAAVRVDLRGSGDSDGVLEDEYLQQELDDGVEVIRWLAEEPWCDGNVGMIGISWGGFNGLQVAALQPPELKAIITVCSTDDRYADDVHHMGGCLLGDNLSWASVMFAYNSCPPDPAIVGERWRDMWLKRLEGSGLWLEKWLRHQNRDDYWQHGSICEDYSRVQCPVYAVSGWADGYTNAVFRMLANLEVPRKGLIGPWSHKYPHLGKPGPAIGFLQEALRWWDHWLKGEDTGIMDEPMLRVWMQDSVPPTTMYKFRPGRWVGEEVWPSPSIETRRMALAPRKLEEPGTSVADQPMGIRSPLSVGLFAGKWCSYTAPPDLPHDQREEDGGALIFDSDPLPEDLEILGAPVVELDLQADRPVGMVAVRLSDVAPDGKATRNTYGLLNLTHRDSHEHPTPLEPGKRYRVRIQLNDIAQSFPAGHRLRVSISTSYWPLAWPPPEPVQLTVHAGTSFFELPVRAPQELDGRLRAFEEPEAASSTEMTLIEPEEHRWTVVRDLAEDVSTLEVINDEGTYRLEPTGTEIQRRTNEWYTYEDDDFGSPRGETFCIRGFRRGDWAVKTHTRTVLTCDRENFHIRAELDAYEGDTRVFSKNWNTSIPRNLV